jgi:hypothetical protein
MPERTLAYKFGVVTGFPVSTSACLSLFSQRLVVVEANRLQWTTNDGDITCILYDSTVRAAFLTAYMSKEYPVSIPIPGYSTPRVEPLGTRVLQAAQSPSGSRFITANAMTEFFLFDRKPDGTLNPRRMKKSSAKIPTGAFKPKNIAVGMPHADVFAIFWIKDGTKPCLRTVLVDDSEHISDLDLRPQFDLLLREDSGSRSDAGSQREGARSAAELHATGQTAPAELPARTIPPVELPNTQIHQLPGSEPWKR